MAQIRKRKFSTLVLCIVFLLTLCGCQETEQFETEDLDRLLLDDGTLAYMESLYGLTREAAIEKLGLSDENATITEYRPGLVDTSWTGLMRINKPTAVQEKEFTKTMGLDHKIALFRAITYTCDCDPQKKRQILRKLFIGLRRKDIAWGPSMGILPPWTISAVKEFARKSGHPETIKFGKMQTEDGVKRGSSGTVPI